MLSLFKLSMLSSLLLGLPLLPVFFKLFPVVIVVTDGCYWYQCVCVNSNNGDVNYGDSNNKVMSMVKMVMGI